MFGLERGDRYSLEGRVIVYVENLKPEGESDRFPLIYSATSPVDIFLFDEDMVDQGEIERIEQKWEETKKRLKHKAKKEDVEGFTPFASRVMSAGSEEDIFEIPGDVINAGKAPGGEFVMGLLESMTKAYMINYSAQVFENMQVSQQVEPKVTDSFKNYDGPGLMQKLSELTSQLYHAIEVGDDRERDHTIATFRQIALHSPFTGEISNIVGIAQTQSPQKTHLIDLYIKMIGAVHGEDYRQAASMREQIQSMSE